MDHNDIRHMLSEYIDGSLTPEDKASVEEHLKTCPDCSNALSELRKTVEHIRKVEEVQPPAWMTQKIMSRVRAEEEKKKQGLFHRIFFPLQVKLPLEAIGVLFVAVTVYFVVYDVQRKESFREAPVQNYSLPEPSQVDKGTAKQDKAAEQADSMKRTREAQEPAYNAPDIKQEHERPQRAPDNGLLPYPSPVEGEGKRERGLHEQTGPGITQYQAPTKEFSGEEAASQAPASLMAKKKAAGIASEEKRAGTARAEMSGKQMLTLVVFDVDQAAARVEDTIKEYGGKIIRKEPAGGALSLTVAIDPESRNRFIDRLKTVGELKSIDAAEIRSEGTTMEIRIVKQIQQELID